jgi:hypothetical protein
MRLSGLIFLVLLGAVAWFAASPWLAFRSLRDAARTGDVPAMARLIDYPAVRRSLEVQLTGAPADQPQEADLFKDPLGALKQALRPDAPAPPVVERYLEPRALAALADGRRPGSPLPPGRREPFPKIAFWGPDRCRIVVTDPDAPWRRADFTFERKGIFSWKLSRIVLPPRGPRESTTAAGAAKAGAS